MLNRFETKEPMDIAYVCGKPYMFLNYRIDRDSVPEDMKAYDVSDASGDGMFCRIKTHILVDHWGTLVGFDEIPAADAGETYACHEPDGCFIDYNTCDGYRAGYDKLLQECAQLTKEADEERARLKNMSDIRLIKDFFSILDDNRDEDICGDAIRYMVFREYAADEVRRRLEEKKDIEGINDAYDDYVSSVYEYLDIREDLLFDSESDDSEAEEAFEKVLKAEKTLKRLFIKQVR